MNNKAAFPATATRTSIAMEKFSQWSSVASLLLVRDPQWEWLCLMQIYPVGVSFSSNALEPLNSSLNKCLPRSYYTQAFSTYQREYKIWHIILPQDLRLKTRLTYVIEKSMGQHGSVLNSLWMGRIENRNTSFTIAV